MKTKLFAGIIALLLLVPFTHARVIPNIPNSDVMPTIPLLPIKASSHKIDTKIKNGIAETTLETVYYNPNNRVLEGTYLFALPKGASVANFSLWIDGKEMPAELLDAKKAQDLYVSIVRKMIDPALLEFVGRETFKMRIFPFPAYGSRKIKLSYEQVLPMDGNLMRYEYPLTAVGNGHDDTIQQFSCNIEIEEQEPIKSVFSPTHKIKVVKEDKKATVTLSETYVETNRDLVVYVSRSNKLVDLSFIPFAEKAEDGYFLMMLSPKTDIDQSEVNAKDIVYVLDTSGSMVGDKMEQAKKALQYCLHQLNEKDNFNIISFSTEAKLYKDNLLDASKDNVKKALKYVDDHIYARGGTNIEEALSYALEMAPKDSTRPFMVILLTDGKPTIGVTDAEDIIKKVQKQTVSNLRLFTFGIGEQLNIKLLDRLAEENRGTREYVSQKEDIEIKISSFVDKVSSPVLSNIKVRFPSSDGLRVTEVYPRQFQDLFKGSHLTVVGRYEGKGDQAIRVSGTMNGKEQEFVYEVSFPEEKTDNDQVPRLWAVRKVGFLLDQIRLNGENEELKKEVVLLAKKFGIVTPYTSYLVVEDTPTVTTQPINPIWRESRQRNENTNFGGAVEDDASFAKEEGESAVKASKDILDMKVAQNAYTSSKKNKEKSDSTEKQIRKVGIKTFYLNGEIWLDSESLTKKATNAKKQRILYLSKQYLELLEKYPQIGKYLALGKQVTLLWDGTIFEIYSEE